MSLGRNEGNERNEGRLVVKDGDQSGEVGGQDGGQSRKNRTCKSTYVLTTIQGRT